MALKSRYYGGVDGCLLPLKVEDSESWTTSVKDARGVLDNTGGLPLSPSATHHRLAAADIRVELELRVCSVFKREFTLTVVIMIAEH